MSWIKACRNWWRDRDDAEPGPFADEIDEELLFHFRSLVNDEMNRGAPFERAWELAVRRFGSLQHYSDECRRIASPGSYRWPLAACVSLFATCLLVAWMLSDLRALRQDLAALRASSGQVVLAAAAAPPQRHDLVGTVVDRDNQPIVDARVLVIVKTWPGGRYRQEAFDTTTDADGRFRLDERIPDEGQCAVAVAAIGPGYALTSIYQLEEEGRHGPFDPVTLRCDRAAPLTLLVQDAAGRPVTNARLLPSSRETADGQTHLVYFQAAQPIEVVADDEGKAPLACFERGDQGEIYVQVPGGDWQRHRIVIPPAGDTVILTLDG